MRILRQQTAVEQGNLTAVIRRDGEKPQFLSQLVQRRSRANHHGVGLIEDDKMFPSLERLQGGISIREKRLYLVTTRKARLRFLPRLYVQDVSTMKSASQSKSVLPSLPKAPTSCVVDAHTHIFCWGENSKDGYLSERTRRSWLTRLLIQLTGIRRETGDNLSAKLRNRFLREVNSSSLDHVFVLAQDAVYHPEGSRNDSQTHFYVSNDYVLDLSKRSPKVLPGCSINPIRSDALQELERCHAAGSRLIKVHTAIQGVDPDRAEFDGFYALAKQLGVILMFHTGYEHSCTVVSQSYTDPRRLERPLSHGGRVIAAHCRHLPCLSNA